MKSSSLAVIKELMKSQLDQTIRQRIGNNVLVQNLRAIGVEVGRSRPSGTSDDGEVVLTSHNYGVLYDVDIGKLSSFVKELPKRGAEAKKSINASAPTSEFDEKASVLGHPRLWWTKGFGQAITPEDDSLVVLNKSEFEISYTADLERRLNRLVRVKERRNEGENVIESMGYIRDGLIDSIREGKTRATEEGLEIYEELISTFLEKLQQWEATYKRDTAIRESRSLGGGWGEMMWISNDLQEIIETAVRTEDIGVLHKVIYFPSKMAIKAVEKRDYYIFREFLNWIPRYYIMACDIEDHRARDFIVQRCSMHLSELIGYYLSSALERSTNESEIDETKDFLLGVIFVFNRLLKNAYDKRNLEHFKGYSHTVTSAFDLLSHRGPHPEDLDLEEQLGHQTMSAVEREKVQRRLSLKRKRLSAVETLQQTVNIMFYGLKAWILHECIDNRRGMSPDDFQKWNAVSPNPNTLQQSCEMFSAAKHAQANDDDFNWSYWESREHERGLAYAGILTFWGGGFDNHLRKLFCVQCLNILGRLNDEQRTNAAASISHDIVPLAGDNNSPLKQTLKQIEENQDNWRPIVGEDALESIPAFRAILADAVEREKERKNERLRAASLSAERVKSVKEEIVDAWKKSAQFREIVHRYGNYQFIHGPAESNYVFGFNELQPKDTYVDDTETEIGGWGAQFGRDLAGSEDENFVKGMTDNLEDWGNVNTEQEVLQPITEALTKLGRAGYDPIVLIMNSWTSSAVIQRSGLFRKEKAQAVPGLIGYFQGRPVLSLHYRGSPFIIVIDLGKFCIWRQFKPLQLFNEEYISEELTFCVRPFTEESAKETVRNNSNLLLDQSGEPRDDSEVVSQLQLQVHFRLLEQFEVEIRDRNSGYKLSLGR